MAHDYRFYAAGFEWDQAIILMLIFNNRFYLPHVSDSVQFNCGKSTNSRVKKILIRAIIIE